jgi:glyoxylase-like metal-dependent hydrolase (beta-lactamase superfamily II)
MTIERVSVGSVEIMSVLDGEMRGPPSFFFSGIPPEMYRPALGDDLESDAYGDSMRAKFGSFLVRSGGKTVLVDTGAGPRNPAMPGGKLIDNLAAMGVRPEDIDVVVNTHLHVDHVGWNCSERDGAFVPTFPRAEYWISRVEWDYWTSPAIVAEEGPHLREGVLPLRDLPQLKLIDGEASITPELQVISTPGHTPGHVSVGVSSGGEQAIILGDVAHHPLNLVRIWLASVDELPRISRRTKRALVERLIKEQTLVCGGHFAPGSFGRFVMNDGQRTWHPLA